jgi:predicted transcriptional regulator
MIRRSKLEVFADIIKVVADEGEIKRTRIMYKANLAWKVLKEALDFLEERGILRSEEKDARVVMSLTDEGFRVLNRLKELEAVFAPQVSPFIGAVPQILATARVEYPI